MSDQALSDSRQASRKGRRPKNGIAMTPAERKRAERQRKRNAKRELPKWCRQRLEIWQWVQERYCLNSAIEVASALSAVGAALNCCTIWKAMGQENFKYPLELLFNPSIPGCATNSSEIDTKYPLELLFNPSMDETISRFLELAPYQTDQSVEEKAPDHEKILLYELLCDILERHEKPLADSEVAK